MEKVITVIDLSVLTSLGGGPVPPKEVKCLNLPLFSPIINKMVYYYLVAVILFIKLFAPHIQFRVILV